PPCSTLFPYTTLFRSHYHIGDDEAGHDARGDEEAKKPFYFHSSCRPARYSSSCLRCASSSARSLVSCWRSPSISVSWASNFLRRSEEHTSELQSRGHL